MTAMNGGHMKLKSKWIYNYRKGIRGALVSRNYYMVGDKLYFVLYFDANYFESHVLELDLNTGEGRSLFQENHVVREIYASDDGKLYFTSIRGRAFCTDLNGTLIWEKEPFPKTASFQIAIDGDRLYLSGRKISCLDRNTGETLWTNDEFQKGTNCNLLISDNALICGEQGGKVFALDKSSGKTIWSYGEEEWISHCTLMANGHLLVNHIHGKFLILDPSTGKLIDSMPAKGCLEQTPVFEGNKMYLGDANSSFRAESGNMTCYEITDGSIRPVFSYPVGGEVTTPALIDGDRLFFASEDSYLYCINKNTGEDLMARKKTKGTCRDIILRGDELIVVSDKAQVECFIIQ